MKKYILSIGTFLGIASSYLFFFGLVRSRRGSGPVIDLNGKISLILTINLLLLILTIRGLRTMKGGYLELREGLKIGFGISIIQGIIFGIASYFYFNNYIYNYRLREKIINLPSRGAPFGRITDQEIIFWQNLSSDPIILAALALITMVISGFLLTFLITLIFKKSRYKT